MIEHEIKFLITEKMFNHYKSFLNHFYNGKRILQINYYFDTNDFLLNSLSRTLRVRQTKHDLRLQYKYDRYYNDKERICKEYEVQIDHLPFNISCELLPNLPSPATYYNYLGSLITERFDYIYNETMLSLDISYYLGICDYEIEIEFQNYENAIEILKLLNIEEFEVNKKGKYNRFVQRYKTLNENLENKQ